MADRDLYTVLGVNPDASSSEIREAYIRISRVVHPDRFDQVKQAVEWRQANEMLKEANRAYDVLRDPEKRARYDAARTSAHTPPPRPQPQSPPPRPKAATTSPPRAAANSSGPAGGSSPLELLPEHVQKRLLERQAGKVPDQYHVQTQGVGWKYFWIVALCGWFLLLFAFADDNRWSGSAVFWFSAITVGVALFIGRNLDWVWRWRQAKLKCRLYVTPLYFIETHLDNVRWWPLWKLQDLKVTHHYRNGGYQYTDLRLVFPEGAQSFAINTKDGAERLLDTLRTLDQRLRLAASNEHWDYFVHNDDFSGAATQSLKRPWFDKVRGMAYGLPLALAVVLMLSAYSVNADNPSLTGIPPQSTYSTPSYSDPVYSPPAAAFNEPIQPLPANGAVQRYGGGRALAPLEIRTRGYDRHYFVKVTDWTTGAPVLTMFIRAGQSAETLVPLGTYRIRYATGETWYGEDFLFGPQTSYSEADQSFRFVDEGYQYSGYTLELFLQQDGNLSTSRIAPDQW